MEPSETSYDRIKECAHLLGLSGTVTSASLKLAYHRAMQKWHPDLHHGKDTMDLAEWNAKKINEAREFLATLPLGTRIPVGPESRSVNRPSMRRQSRTTQDMVFDDPQANVYLLKCTVFAAAAYADRTKILYLRFHSGLTYRYLKVPKTIVSRFLRSRSKVTYATRNIFYSFTYSRC